VEFVWGRVKRSGDWIRYTKYIFPTKPLMRVLYKDRRPTFRHSRATGEYRPSPRGQRARYHYLNFLFGGIDLIRTKGVSLRHEKEWRICVLLALCKKRAWGMYFRRIPRSCIKQVILGARCGESTQRRLITAARKHIPRATIRMVQLSSSHFQLTSSPINELLGRGSIMRHISYRKAPYLRRYRPSRQMAEQNLAA
jgi:hypothetical protein